MRRLGQWLLCWLLLAPRVAHADGEPGRVGAGGYLRVMARPDLQGGAARLGYWNLYGRLLNEGPYGVLELRLEPLPETPGSSSVWTSVGAKLEGGSVQGADALRGSLGAFALTQLYAQAGNVLLAHVTWRVGTLQTYLGELGLYDMRPAELFYGTVGASARFQHRGLDVLVGVGDNGWALHGGRYASVPTAGATVRTAIGDHFQLGVGGQLLYEPEVRGSPNAPYQTPGLEYADYVRGELAQRFFERNPDRLRVLDAPSPRAASSYKAVAYLGFGELGLLRWNNLFASYERKHPLGPVVEGFGGESYEIYVSDFTDERYSFVLGDELTLTVVPGRFDLAWAALYGIDQDRDDSVAASERNRTYASTVLRGHVYLSPLVHLLAESSLANERSDNGALFREHFDSITAHDGGLVNSRGLSYGDTDRRTTVQLKGGVVLSPMGTGLYTRPSLRLLYGAQYSNVHDAFASSIEQTLDETAPIREYTDRHWHHLVALEAEAWF